MQAWVASPGLGPGGAGTRAMVAPRWRRTTTRGCAGAAAAPPA